MSVSPSASTAPTGLADKKLSGALLSARGPGHARTLVASKSGSEKKWLGWFRPLSRGWREGSLVAVPIEISKDKSLRLPLVITVPGACGNAVLRNRFRRMTKAYFEKRLAEAVRINEGSLNPPRNSGESDSVPPEAHGAPAQNVSVPAKAIWIRLLNRHRLDRKIRLEDWERDFETLAAKALS